MRIRPAPRWSRRLAGLPEMKHGASTYASGEASLGCVRVGRDNMNRRRRLLFLVFFTALAAVASPQADAQRGLTVDPPPASRPGSGPAERAPSAPNAVIAQGTN